MFEHMQIITLRASYMAKRSGQLPPYLGSTIRGVLGHCMREFACAKLQEHCNLCDRQKECIYALCFCSPGNVAGSVNPFVLYSDARGKTEWSEGDICTFDLTLIGNIAKQAGIFIDALQAMGERGWGAERIPFELQFIWKPADNRLIYSGGRLWMRNIQADVLQCEQREARSILLQFDTPVRIVKSKQLCETLDFETIVQFMSRRLSLLSQAYTGSLIQWEEEKLLEAARQVQTVQTSFRTVDFTRYSMRQKGNKLELPAIEGWVRYEGDITAFTPLLSAGQTLHIGKNSTIGFGHYQLLYDR